MESSLDEPGRPGDSPGPLPQAAAFELCELVGSLVVANEASAIAALELAARAGGADAALFVWVIPDDDRCWYRSIAALDPEWSASAMRRLHSGPCVAAHAARSASPCLSVHISTTSMVSEGAGIGRPRAIWLIPATAVRHARILMLAGEDEHRLDATSRCAGLPGWSWDDGWSCQDENCSPFT
jgi:hypothetical protein